jgi:hypothetical protein
MYLKKKKRFEFGARVIPRLLQKSGLVDSIERNWFVLLLVAPLAAFHYTERERK